MFHKSSIILIERILTYLKKLYFYKWSKHVVKVEFWRVTLLAKMTNQKLTTADKKWSLLWKKIVV